MIAITLNPNTIFKNSKSNKMSKIDENTKKTLDSVDSSDEVSCGDQQIKMNELELTLPVMSDSKRRITSQDWCSSSSQNETITLPNTGNQNKISKIEEKTKNTLDSVDSSDEVSCGDQQIKMNELELTLPMMPGSKKRITSQDWYSSRSLNEIATLPKDFSFENSCQDEGDPKTSALPDTVRSFSQSYDSFFDNSPFTGESFPFNTAPSQDKLNISTSSQGEADVEKVFCTPTDLDVLLGRGGLTNNHAGNIRYREEVEKVKPMYFKCMTKAEKKEVSELLVAYVEDYGGRFLIKDEETSNWMLAPFKAARKKASQALRETKWKSSKEKKRKKEEDKPG